MYVYVHGVTETTSCWFLSIILASQSMMWLREMVWSVTADLLCSVAADLLMLRVYALTSHCVTSCWCSCSHTPKALPVSRLQVLWQFLHGILYTHSHASCCLHLACGCTRRLLIDVAGIQTGALKRSKDRWNQSSRRSSLRKYPHSLWYQTGQQWSYHTLLEAVTRAYRWRGISTAVKLF